MPLKNNLKKFRNIKGLNQQELGGLVGVSRQIISLIERGDYNPSITVCLKLAKVLKKTLKIFLFMWWIVISDGNRIEKLDKYEDKSLKSFLTLIFILTFLLAILIYFAKVQNLNIGRFTIIQMLIPSSVAMTTIFSFKK